MSNYVKTTDFAVKDSLVSGSPAKIIKGAEFDTEFNNIASAISGNTTDIATNTANIATNTADIATNTADIATKQASLGFTPVQQGGGLGGQLTNKIYLGYTAAGLVRLTVDATDFGGIQFRDTAASFTTLTALSNTQTNYSTAAIQSVSSSGNVFITLHASGSSAASIKHTRGGNGIAVVGTDGVTVANLAVGATTCTSLTSSGNVTAFSDERLKINWSPVQDNFVDKLSQIKSGTFNRLDIDSRQAGVSAQSLQELLPEAVIEDESGFLSVAYGSAALVACVELAKEVAMLRAEIERLK